MDVLNNFWNTYFGNTTMSDVFSSIIVLVICLIVIKIFTTLTSHAIIRSKLDKRMQKFVMSAVKIVLYVLTALIVADSLGIPITSLIALLSVASLAVSLAVQGMLSNLAGGIVILTAHPFNIGDFIDAAGITGTVKEIDLIYTKLDTVDGQRVLIPNSDMSASKITNYTTLGNRRIALKIGASYDAPVAEVRSAFMDAVAMTDGILQDPAPTVVVEEYQDSAIAYSVFVWVIAADYIRVKYALNENVKTAFDNHNIEMTYNHLNVHIIDK